MPSASKFLHDTSKSIACIIAWVDKQQCMMSQAKHMTQVAQACMAVAFRAPKGIMMCPGPPAALICQAADNRSQLLIPMRLKELLYAKLLSNK